MHRALPPWKPPLRWGPISPAAIFCFYELETSVGAADNGSYIGAGTGTGTGIMISRLNFTSASQVIVTEVSQIQKEVVTGVAGLIDDSFTDDPENTTYAQNEHGIVTVAPGTLNELQLLLTPDGRLMTGVVSEVDRDDSNTGNLFDAAFLIGVRVNSDSACN